MFGASPGARSLDRAVRSGPLVGSPARGRALLAALTALAASLHLMAGAAAASAAAPTPGLIVDAAAPQARAATASTAALAATATPAATATGARSPAAAAQSTGPTVSPSPTPRPPLLTAQQPTATPTGVPATATAAAPTPTATRPAAPPSPAAAPPLAPTVTPAPSQALPAGPRPPAAATQPVQASPTPTREGGAARSAAAASANQPVQSPALVNAPPPRITFVAPSATVPAAAAVSPTPVMIARLAPTRGSVRGWIEGQLLALEVPIRSQFDGTEYQASNCGPTSMAMVLDSFGVAVPTEKLRNLANVLQGTYDRETGIALDYLAEIAREAGLRPLGLRGGDASYRRWSIADLRNEVRRGHPVLTLVKMRELPDHAGARSETDHYVVVVGLDGEQLLINDPALPADGGFRRPIAPTRLERAWDAASIPRQAIAIAAGDGVPELSFADPLGPAAPAPAAVLEPAMLLPSLPPPVGWPATPLPAPEPAPYLPAPAVEAAAAPIVLLVTPAAPPVVIVQVAPPALVTPTPLPPSERWGRPASYPAAPVLAPSPQESCRGSAWTSRLPGEGTGCEPILLAPTTQPAPSDSPLRSAVIVAELLASVAVLRWALR